MIFEISAFIAAIAFAVLVFYIIRTLLTAQQSLERVSSTLATLEQTVVEMKGDLKSSVKHVSVMTANVQQQLDKITPLVNSVENAGEALEEVTSAAKQVSVGLIKGVRKSVKRNRQMKADAGTSDKWKTWIDLGTKAWRLYRSN